MIWVWFAVVQAIQLIAAGLGLVILIPFCLMKAWSVRAKSIKDERAIDLWNFSLLNIVYGNPEDGVSGQQAVVWPNGVPSPYLPSTNSILRAWLWSGVRNSCDNLKYVFANKKGPLKTFTLGGRSIKLGSYKVTIPHLSLKVGWQLENGFNVPVFSID